MKKNVSERLVKARAEVERYIGNLIRNAQATIDQGAINEDDSFFVEMGRFGLERYAEPVLQSLSKQKRSADDVASCLEDLFRVLTAVLFIGRHSSVTMSAKKITSLERAYIAQKKNHDLAADRRVLMRDAIEAECSDINLSTSSSFAVSIEHRVRERCKVGPDARGFSSRSIQREISAILKERQNS